MTRGETGSMTPHLGAHSRVVVVLDRAYGERLRALWAGQPIWIELSPLNEPVVHEIWEQSHEPSHLTGITGLKFDPAVSPEERLLADLDTIDLHHGAYSSSTPYTELNVLGCPLNNRIRGALAELGFADFEEQDLGFVARRTSEQAAIRR